MARRYSQQVVSHRRGVRVHDLKKGTVVRSRVGSSGTATGKRGIIIGVAPSSNFSRAYGKEYFVCTIHGDYPNVSRRNSSQFVAAGKVKRIPKSCEAAMRDYDERYPQLGRRKRR